MHFFVFFSNFATWKLQNGVLFVRAGVCGGACIGVNVYARTMRRRKNILRNIYSNAEKMQKTY